MSPSTWEHRALSRVCLDLRRAELGCPGGPGAGLALGPHPLHHCLRQRCSCKGLHSTSPTSPSPALPAPPGAPSGVGRPLQSLLTNRLALLKPDLLSQIGFRYRAARWGRSGRGGLCSAPCGADGTRVCPLITHLVWLERCFKCCKRLPRQQAGAVPPCLARVI